MDVNVTNTEVSLAEKTSLFSLHALNPMLDFKTLRQGSATAAAHIQVIRTGKSSKQSDT
jgi:hypothetical protein